MFRKISIPSSYTLIQQQKTYLLLHNDFKDSLIRQGIEDLPTFFKTHLQTAQYLQGRTPHPVVPLEDGRRMVIRKYSHGGLFRFLSRDLFLSGTRSIKELTLTEEIRSSGIPTVQPIGAIHLRVYGPLYRAFLFTLEMSSAKNLIQYFHEMESSASPEKLFHKRNMIRNAGFLLRQFHQKGFYHGDLQLKNLLVLGNQVLIIDFDRSYHKTSLSTSERTKNLLRLYRSAEKWRHFGLPVTRTDSLRFLKAYAGEDRKILKAVRKALWTYSIRLFIHRIGWSFQKKVD